MLHITIPGYGNLRLRHLVLDFNGTLACDGRLLPGVRERLDLLAETLKIHVLTADTFGRATKEMSAIPCELAVLPPENQDGAKRRYLEPLGPEAVVAVGNGRNDRGMLEAAALGLAVVQAEGAAVETILAADVVVPDILAALDLLAKPMRLTATLRA
ncbi:MAG: ATPase P [Desulfuromonadales bacterium]|jgi:soluble P-type ATPase